MFMEEHCFSVNIVAQKPMLLTNPQVVSLFRALEHDSGFINDHLDTQEKAFAMNKYIPSSFHWGFSGLRRSYGVAQGYETVKVIGRGSFGFFGRNFWA